MAAPATIETLEVVTNEYELLAEMFGGKERVELTLRYGPRSTSSVSLPLAEATKLRDLLNDLLPKASDFADSEGVDWAKEEPVDMHGVATRGEGSRS